MKKLACLLISFVMIMTVIPTTSTDAAQRITSRKELSGKDYTSSKKLASKLNDVFKGKIGLYSGGQVKAPVGSSKVSEHRMYSVKNRTTGTYINGWQCYIYANAVYNTLFNETVGHADSFSHSKKVISKGGRSLSYKKLKKADVRTGAYVRVASSYSGCYNGNNGHSFIILSYDKKGISYIEGNSDNHGLISVTECTWAEFNYKMLGRLSRKVCYVVQPTKEYYNSLYHTPEKVSLSKIDEPEQNEVNLKWNKVTNAKGYQIQYAKDKNFKKDADVETAKSSAKSKTIDELEHGETYYFKVRAYNKVGKSKVYGKWSKVRKATTAEEVVDEPEMQEQSE